MQRNNPDVKLEFVCEENDEKNLMTLAENGNVADLKFYLKQMSPEKINNFFNSPVLSNQFANKFPSKKIAEDFTTAVLASKQLMPHIPVDFYTIVSLLPEKRQSPGLFSPQPARMPHDAVRRLTRSFSPGK